MSYDRNMIISEAQEIRVVTQNTLRQVCCFVFGGIKTGGLVLVFQMIYFLLESTGSNNELINRTTKKPEHHISTQNIKAMGIWVTSHISFIQLIPRRCGTNYSDLNSNTFLGRKFSYRIVVSFSNKNSMLFAHVFDFLVYVIEWT